MRTIAAHRLPSYARHRADIHRKLLYVACAWLVAVLFIAVAQVVLDTATASIFEMAGPEAASDRSSPLRVAEAVERGARRDLLVFER